ncbi:uncharacterized protein LOC126474636 [Schistocerca serialis cubense]|uniref:uncharacterized protein LOC126474636 n=1 Tax=Schistocerca serialis cubense TaxID=2023355 RepID=UPI00214E8385|nr:uncharacterized protein LOC126474636 [Schistocerca serialis cubense]
MISRARSRYCDDKIHVGQWRRPAQPGTESVPGRLVCGGAPTGLSAAHSTAAGGMPRRAGHSLRRRRPRCARIPPAALATHSRSPPSRRTRRDSVRGGFQPRLPTSLPPPGQQQQPSPLPRRQPVPLMPPAQLHPGAPQVVAPAPAVPLQSPPPSELMDVDPSAGPPSQAVAVQPVLQPLSLGTPKESDTAAPCPAPTQQPSTQPLSCGRDCARAGRSLIISGQGCDWGRQRAVWRDGLINPRRSGRQRRVITGLPARATLPPPPLPPALSASVGRKPGAAERRRRRLAVTRSRLQPPPRPLTLAQLCQPRG